MKNSGEEYYYPRYVDLAPNPNADGDGVYSHAILEALENPRVKNIALTGPYGSGKSSVIQAFERLHHANYKFLNISLAAFDAAKDSPATDEQSRLIERSILQQMLYGAEANKLPYSRFKRITTPTKALLRSGIIVLWLTLVGYLILLCFSKVPNVFGIEESLVYYFIVSLFVGFILGVPIIFGADAYRATFGISLRKISLKNAEIETGELSENSILNRHIDEIIYFFQETRYNVVIIEDLDRFKSPDIFVKLREINKILNDNKSTPQNIKFIYALKDSVFDNVDRVKFFDFIVPLIPVINHSNSYDKILERITGLPFEPRIHKEFLREISLYLNDLRLINNIFNEFEIYYRQIDSKQLDLNKLLASIVYKNVYPSDFEDLHDGSGYLFGICNQRLRLIGEVKKDYGAKISDLRQALIDAESIRENNQEALIATYLGLLAQTGGEAISGVVIGGTNVLFSNIKTIDQLEQLRKEGNIEIWHFERYYNNNRRVDSGITFSDLENKVNPGTKIREQALAASNKSQNSVTKILQDISRLERESILVASSSLSELLSERQDILQNYLPEEERKSPGVFSYLVRNGYIDESYHLYISKFYAGRMTSNDRNFLLSVRNHSLLDANQPIDTPEEICVQLRSSDFTQKYVLNVYLVDFLLENRGIHNINLRSLSHNLAEHFEESAEFLRSYLDAGKHPIFLVEELLTNNPNVLNECLVSEFAEETVSLICRNVTPLKIIPSNDSQTLITRYLNSHAPKVFAKSFVTPDNLDFLKQLNVKFQSLRELRGSMRIVDFAYEHGLYEINIDNVLFLLNRIISNQDKGSPESQVLNLSMILSLETERIYSFVKKHLSSYVLNVFFEMPNHTEESRETILFLLSEPSLSLESKEKILASQSYVFEKIQDIPKDLWDCAVTEDRVMVSWLNLGVYLSEGGDSEEAITSIFNDPKKVEILAKSRDFTGLEEEAKKAMSKFVVSAIKIPNNLFSEIVVAVPYFYREFFLDDSDKRMILAEKRVVRLDERSFESAASDAALQAKLISRNYETYSSKEDSFPLSDKVRSILLDSKLNHSAITKLCSEISSQSIVESAETASKIAKHCIQNDVDISVLPVENITAAIIHSQSITSSISLLAKAIPIFDESTVMGILSELPDPYSDIATYRKRPKLPNNTENRSLASALEERGFISSSPSDGDHIRINTKQSP